MMGFFRGWYEALTYFCAGRLLWWLILLALILFCEIVAVLYILISRLFRGRGGRGHS